MITLESIAAFFGQLWQLNEVKVIASGVVLNTVLAIAGALKERVFNLRDLGDFLTRDLAPKTIVYGAFHAFGDASGFGWVPTVAFALIAAQLAARILGQLQAFGITAPEAITGKHERG